VSLDLVKKAGLSLDCQGIFPIQLPSKSGFVFLFLVGNKDWKVIGNNRK